MPSARSLLLGTVASAAIACGPPRPATDAGNDTAVDSGAHDSDAMDSGGPQDSSMPGTDGAMPGTDGGGDDGAVVGHCTTGTSFTSTCAAPVDLSVMGTTTGATTTITGNNCMAGALPRTDVTEPSCATGDTMSPAGYAVVFDYTMRATGDLVAETDLGSDTHFDSIVWIVDGCGASANELACNDDNPDGSNQLSIATTSQSIPAGTHVKIIVAGYTPTTIDGTTNTTNFTLTVTEHALVAMGGTCDPTDPFCADGTTCVATSATATTGTCNANGTEGAACLTTGAACTGTSHVGALPLGCYNPMDTVDDPGVCLGVNPNGAVCTEDDPLCVTGSTCIPDAVDGGVSETTGRCLVDGTLGGACRATDPPCDAGTCDPDTDLCM